jgi:hypothetical protein
VSQPPEDEINAVTQLFAAWRIAYFFGLHLLDWLSRFEGRGG